ncbi:MAG: lmo0937 family membrane protein [Chloroflexota bacterium]
MLTWIIVILLILWLLGYFGPNVFSGFPRSGNVVHVLLVIALILVVLTLLGVI